MLFRSMANIVVVNKVDAASSADVQHVIDEARAANPHAIVVRAASPVRLDDAAALRGRRVLKYAPLHHHFTRVGWPETWVVQRFWIAGAVGALVAIWASQW